MSPESITIMSQLRQQGGATGRAVRETVDYLRTLEDRLAAAEGREKGLREALEPYAVTARDIIELREEMEGMPLGPNRAGAVMAHQGLCEKLGDALAEHVVALSAAAGSAAGARAGGGTGEMGELRWRFLNSNGEGMTPAEINAGWHYCPSWDDLLIGPGMDEMSACECAKRPPTQNGAKNATGNEG